MKVERQGTVEHYGPGEHGGQNRCRVCDHVISFRQHLVCVREARSTPWRHFHRECYEAQREGK